MTVSNKDVFSQEFDEFFNFNLLKEYFSLTHHEDRLKYLLNKNLINLEDAIIGRDDNKELSYILMFPNLDKKFFDSNIMLVSHIDDVYEDDAKMMGKTRRNIHIEEGEKGFVLLADYENELGLGADDGLGVLSSLFLYHLFKKYDYEKTPVVLICNYEERHGIGAEEFCRDVMYGRLYEVSRDDIDKITYMIELDRRDCKDCVFYNDEPEEFVRYIESFGFERNRGAFSDIEVLGEYFNKCSVNLSIGYFNNHNPVKERADLGCTKETLYKVINMIYHNHEQKKIWYNNLWVFKLSYNKKEGGIIHEYPTKNRWIWY